MISKNVNKATKTTFLCVSRSQSREREKRSEDVRSQRGDEVDYAGS